MLEMAELNHICGPATAATQPSRSAYRSHQNQRYRHGMLSPPCGKALAERAWAVAEQRAQKELPDFLEGYQAVGSWRPDCGGLDDITAPTRRGYSWHRYADQSEPCPKCKGEATWALAERQAQKELPDWPKTYKPRTLPPRPASA